MKFIKLTDFSTFKIERAICPYSNGASCPNGVTCQTDHGGTCTGYNNCLSMVNGQGSTCVDRASVCQGGMEAPPGCALFV